jgi:hypothetical protein
MIAIAIGEICGAIASAHALAAGSTDFAQIWYGARALLDGRNPYAVVGPGRTLEWGFPLLYPLPALLVGLPFALAPAAIAVGLFVGLSAALLSFGLTRENWHRLVLLVSAPFMIAVLYGQWSMLLTAAVLLSPFGILLVAKPTVGAALWAYRPALSSLIGGILLVLLSIGARPSWIGEWLATLSHTRHMVVPLVHSGGPLLLLAILRWRRPEARLLLALACVPQTALPYEAVPLLLVPATLGESALFVALSLLAAWLWIHLGPYSTTSASIPTSVRLIVPLLYLPCLIMVLRRPNEGGVPDWIAHSLTKVRTLRMVRSRL